MNHTDCSCPCHEDNKGSMQCSDCKPDEKINSNCIMKGCPNPQRIEGQNYLCEHHFKSYLTMVAEGLMPSEPMIKISELEEWIDKHTDTFSHSKTSRYIIFSDELQDFLNSHKPQSPQEDPKLSETMQMPDNSPGNDQKTGSTWIPGKTEDLILEFISHFSKSESISMTEWIEYWNCKTLPFINTLVYRIKKLEEMDTVFSGEALDLRQKIRMLGYEKADKPILGIEEIKNLQSNKE